MVHPAPLRVLVVDGNPRVSVGACFMRALRMLGHDAHFLDNAPWLGGWNPAFAARVGQRLANPIAIPAFNAYVLAQTARLKPDLFLVFKGTAIYSRTIAQVRRWARTSAVFQNDDVRNDASTTDDMRKAIPLWDVIFTPRAFALDELRKDGARRAELLRFAYDPTLFYPAEAPDLDPSLASSAVFVGTGLPERVAALEEVAKRVPVVIFGNGWGGVSRSSPLRAAVRPAVFEARLRSIYSSAGVNIAFVAKANRDEHTMRTFEIPACGGFMLAERSKVHTELFREGEEVALFGSTEELARGAEEYLGQPERRRRVAAAGRRRVQGRERYLERAAQLVETVRVVAAAAR